jgi:hypothetical protein
MELCRPVEAAKDGPGRLRGSNPLGRPGFGTAKAVPSSGRSTPGCEERDVRRRAIEEMRESTLRLE